MEKIDAKRAANRGYKLRWKLLMERFTDGMDITRRHLGLLVILLVVGISASVMTFVVVKGWEHSRTHADFNRRFDQALTALSRSVEVDLSILDSVAGLQSVAQGVSKAEFESMTKLGWSRQTAIQALAWAPKVGVYDRESYEARAQREGLAGYKIHEYTAKGFAAPAAERPDYFPVYYLEPLAGNEPLLGLDLKSQPTYQIAMAQARDTGRPTATRRILLETGEGTRNAFIVVTPVYRGGATDLTLSERKEHLKGFAVGVFLVDDLVDASLTHLDDLMKVSVVDDSDDAGGEHRALYGELPGAPDRSDPAQRFATTRTLTVGGRTWTLHARPTPQYLHSQRTWQAEGLLVAGLQFVALLDAYLLLVFGRTTQVERLVNQRTSQLTKTNHDLKREIIQRKATERALRNSEERIKSILDGAAGLIDLHDASGSNGNGQAGPWLSASSAAPNGQLQLTMSDAGGADDQGALPLATVGGEVAAPRGGGDVTVLRSDGGEAGEQVVGKVSRDLRSPLSSMLFAAKILAKHRALGPDKVARFADIVVNEGKRLTGLINQALDLSTLEAARGRALTINPVEAETLLEGLATAVEAYAGRKEIKLTIMADEDVQPVMADNTRIEQVLINLTENAIKFTPARGEVRVVVTRQNANYVRFSVSDSGVGMSVTEQEKAFDAFSQDADVLKTASEGSGFGLASCKEIVERHGGTIWVDSQVGVGSTFSFTLPVVNKRQAKLEHCA